MNLDALDVFGVMGNQFARAENSDPLIIYAGSGWATATASTYSGGDMRYARGAGRSFSCCFSGTAVRWITLRSPSYGVARVTLDGGTPEYVSLYSPTTAFNQLVYSRVGLDNTTHTLKVEWTGMLGGVGGGDYISLDALDLSGTLVPAPVRYENSSPAMVYSGSGWATATAGVFSGGDMRYGRGVGTTVTATFTGTSVELVCLRSPNYGIAHVSVDGGPPEDVNLHSGSTATLFRQIVFTRSGLSAGTHTIKVEWTGAAGGAGGGDFINIDAIDVRGGPG